MIDPENEVYTRVATILRDEFPNINISGEFVNEPSSFPHVSFVLSDNSVVSDRTTMDQEFAQVMFEVNVYSNKKTGKKTEAKKIVKSIDEKMFSMNFRRTALTPVPNLDDGTIYRLVARYVGVTDGEFFYRR